MKTSMKILIFTICLIAIIPLAVFASTLTLKVTTDKSKYEIGDNVTATVDWTEKMQAASFVLRYDSDILEFKSASIANSNYNSDTVGEISVNWASLEEKDLTKMTFEFKTKKTGSANISIKSANAFSDGNMVSPTDYEISSKGTINISVNAKSSSEEEKNVKEENTVKKETKVENTISTKTADTKAVSQLPKAGVATVLLPIVIISILGIIGYVKYKKLSGV